MVVSYCVINLSADKPTVFAETFRVLKPGGRIGDYVGCIAGALSFTEYRQGLETAGFTNISIAPSHQIADGMHSAIAEGHQARLRACRCGAADGGQDNGRCCG